MIGGETSVSWLLYILSNNRDWNFQIYAAHALGEIGDYHAVPKLVEVLHTGWRDVRSVAADALGRISHKSAVPGLLDALYARDWSPNGRFPYAVTRALANIGDDDAIRALQEATQMDDEDVRQAAIIALGYAGKTRIMAKRPRPER